MSPCTSENNCSPHRWAAWQWRRYERGRVRHGQGASGADMAEDRLVGLGAVCRGRQDPKRKADLDDYFSEGGGATVAWGLLSFSSGRRRGPSTPGGRCGGLSCVCSLRRATWSHQAAACGHNQISKNHKCKDAIWDLLSGVSALETCQSFLLPPPLPPLQPPNHQHKNDWQISEMQGFHWGPGFLRLDWACR